MPKLVVLDVSENHSLDELPEAVSELNSLRYLDLSYTCISKLPVGLWELKKLIHLNLEHMSILGIIAGISNLWNLRTLGLRESKILIDISLVEELELLEHLEVVTTDISSKLVAKTLLGSQRLVECLREIDIKHLEKVSVIRVLTLPTIVNLRSLSIKKCGMRDIKIESTISSCFPNLSRVFITKCHGLKDLTWLLFAPNLSFLEVGFSTQLEDIISEEKAVSITDDVIIPFRKLETLHLFNLRGLERIYWNALPFPLLKVMCIDKCPKLRKLPLDSKSGIAELVISCGEREWIESVEWEDEATRFLPSSRWRWTTTQ